MPGVRIIVTPFVLVIAKYNLLQSFAERDHKVCVKRAGNKTEKGFMKR